MNLQTLANLTTLYNEPHRHYHNLNHIMLCLGELEKYQSDTKNYDYTEEIITAIWWHDAVYNPYSGENEFNSEKLFQSSFDERNNIMYRSGKPVHVISTAIERTAHHTQDQDLIFLNFTYASTLYVTKLLLDIDLAGLGSEPVIFDKNSEDIRKEFHFISEKEFLTNRIKFFESMLARKRLYYIDYFYEKYESHARKNMERGIAIAKIQLNSI